MSSDIFAHALALHQKAEELGKKGHLLRAAENFGLAAEASRALAVDNVAEAYMQLRQVNMLCIDRCALYRYAKAQSAAQRAVVIIPKGAAHRSECITLLSGVFAVLQRRRAAGTLLEGRCAAVEEAWFHTFLREILGYTLDVASYAPLVGYEQFLHAASKALDVLSNAHLFAPDCSALQFESFAQHVVHATELMQKPRRHCRFTILEGEFASNFRRVTDQKPGFKGLDARLVQLVVDAWQRFATKRRAGGARLFTSSCQR